MKVGTYLRSIRLSRGLGLRASAREMGISSSYLSAVELNQENPPNMNMLLRMSKYLKCNYEYLLLLAGYLPQDVSDILEKYPFESCDVLRYLDSLDDNQRSKFVEYVSTQIG